MAPLVSGLRNYPELDPLAHGRLNLIALPRMQVPASTRQAFCWMAIVVRLRKVSPRRGFFSSMAGKA
jgi:hypothetical protein